jgi:prepilin-type N-terminal cleavage/methylation domain-containing protein
MTKSANSNNFPNQKGFTFIEILIAVVILVLITLLMLASFTTLRQQVEIDSSSQNILSVLRLARSKTLASESEDSYGVHFQSDKYVLFKGTTYNALDSNNKDYTLTDSEINSISLNGGGGDVIFNRIRGTTDEYGTVTIRLLTDTSKTHTININNYGQVSLNDTVTVSSTRVFDSRHLHFNLGWSIQNSTTLTLAYTDSPNPPVTQNIAMSGYFNVGKTLFDWSGTVDVNGAEQELRIHTHSLDAFNTTLSINRDIRYNNKALTVSVDGQTIVTYTAAGVATVGAFGGTMTVQ